MLCVLKASNKLFASASFQKNLHRLNQAVSSFIAKDNFKKLQRSTEHSVAHVDKMVANVQ